MTYNPTVLASHWFPACLRTRIESAPDEVETITQYVDALCARLEQLETAGPTSTPEVPPA